MRSPARPARDEDRRSSSPSSTHPLGSSLSSVRGRASLQFARAPLSPAVLSAYAHRLNLRLPADAKLLVDVIDLLQQPLPNGWAEARELDCATSRVVYVHAARKVMQFAHPDEDAHRRALMEAKWGHGTYLAGIMARIAAPVKAPDHPPDAAAHVLHRLAPRALHELAGRYGAYDRAEDGRVLFDDFVASIRTAADGLRSRTEIRRLWQLADPSALGYVDFAMFAEAGALEGSRAFSPWPDLDSSFKRMDGGSFHDEAQDVGDEADNGGHAGAGDDGGSGGGGIWRETPAGAQRHAASDVRAPPLQSASRRSSADAGRSETGQPVSAGRPDSSARRRSAGVVNADGAPAAPLVRRQASSAAAVSSARRNSTGRTEAELRATFHAELRKAEQMARRVVAEHAVERVERERDDGDGRDGGSGGSQRWRASTPTGTSRDHQRGSFEQSGETSPRLRSSRRARISFNDDGTAEREEDSAAAAAAERGRGAERQPGCEREPAGPPLRSAMRGLSAAASTGAVAAATKQQQRKQARQQQLQHAHGGQPRSELRAAWVDSPANSPDDGHARGGASLSDSQSTTTHHDDARSATARELASVQGPLMPLAPPPARFASTRIDTSVEPSPLAGAVGALSQGLMAASFSKPQGLVAATASPEPWPPQRPPAPPPTKRAAAVAAITSAATSTAAAIATANASSFSAAAVAVPREPNPLVAASAAVAASARINQSRTFAARPAPTPLSHAADVAASPPRERNSQVAASLAAPASAIVDALAADGGDAPARPASPSRAASALNAQRTFKPPVRPPPVETGASPSGVRVRQSWLGVSISDADHADGVAASASTSATWVTTPPGAIATAVRSVRISRPSESEWLEQFTLDIHRRIETPMAVVAPPTVGAGSLSARGGVPSVAARPALGRPARVSTAALGEPSGPPPPARRARVSDALALFETATMGAAAKPGTPLRGADATASEARRGGGSAPVALAHRRPPAAPSQTLDALGGWRSADRAAVGTPLRATGNATNGWAAGLGAGPHIEAEGQTAALSLPAAGPLTPAEYQQVVLIQSVWRGHTVRLKLRIAIAVVQARLSVYREAAKARRRTAHGRALDAEAAARAGAAGVAAMRLGDGDDRDGDDDEDDKDDEQLDAEEADAEADEPGRDNDGDRDHDDSSKDADDDSLDLMRDSAAAARAAVRDDALLDAARRVARDSAAAILEAVTSRASSRAPTPAATPNSAADRFGTVAHADAAATRMAEVLATSVTGAGSPGFCAASPPLGRKPAARAAAPDAPERDAFPPAAAEDGGAAAQLSAGARQMLSLYVSSNTGATHPDPHATPAAARAPAEPTAEVWLADEYATDLLAREAVRAGGRPYRTSDEAAELAEARARDAAKHAALRALLGAARDGRSRAAGGARAARARRRLIGLHMSAAKVSAASSVDPMLRALAQLALDADVRVARAQAVGAARADALRQGLCALRARAAAAMRTGAGARNALRHALRRLNRARLAERVAEDVRMRALLLRHLPVAAGAFNALRIQTWRDRARDWRRRADARAAKAGAALPTLPPTMPASTQASSQKPVVWQPGTMTVEVTRAKVAPLDAPGRGAADRVAALDDWARTGAEGGAAGAAGAKPRTRGVPLGRGLAAHGLSDEPDSARGAAMATLRAQPPAEAQYQMQLGSARTAAAAAATAAMAAAAAAANAAADAADAAALAERTAGSMNRTAASQRAAAADDALARSRVAVSSSAAFAQTRQTPPTATLLAKRSTLARSISAHGSGSAITYDLHGRRVSVTKVAGTTLLTHGDGAGARAECAECASASPMIDYIVIGVDEATDSRMSSTRRFARTVASPPSARAR